jgi:hypothetical protein
MAIGMSWGGTTDEFRANDGAFANEQLHTEYSLLAYIWQNSLL